MKQTLIALMLAVVLGVSLMAKDIAYTACTSDHKIATLTVTLTDQAPATVEASVRAAFTGAASDLTAEELVSREGFIAFLSGLSDEDKQYIVSLSGAPEIVAGSCK